MLHRGGADLGTLSFSNGLTRRGAAAGRLPVFSRGFTLPELIAVLLVSAILVGVAAPRFIRTGFDEARLQADALSALRYAQSSAIAMQRTVCVSFTATTMAVNYDSGAYVYSPITLTCPTPLKAPQSGDNYTVTASGSATFSSFPTSIKFDRQGRPYDNSGTLLSAAQVITLSNGLQVTIERESGHVH